MLRFNELRNTILTLECQAQEIPLVFQAEDYKGHLGEKKKKKKKNIYIYTLKGLVITYHTRGRGGGLEEVGRIAINCGKLVLAVNFLHSHFTLCHWRLTPSLLKTIWPSPKFPPPMAKIINWSLRTLVSLMLASSPPPLYFSLPYEWLSDVPLVITLPQLFCSPSAHFWLVQHGDIDWQVWQVAIKILVQNNASVTYDQKDQSGWRRGSVNWCKLFFKGTSPDNSGNTLIYSFKNFFRLRSHAYSHIIHVT